MLPVLAAVVRKGAVVVAAVAAGAAGMAALDGANVFASIENRAPLGTGEQLVNQSVSFDTTPGTLASFRPVPTGVFWEVQTLRATNCEAEPRAMEFVLADQDGTTHAVLSLEGATPTVVPPKGALAWHGSVKIPAHWRVYARWHGMAGGQRCNWQYTAIERPASG